MQVRLAVLMMALILYPDEEWLADPATRREM